MPYGNLPPGMMMPGAGMGGLNLQKASKLEWSKLKWHQKVWHLSKNCGKNVESFAWLYLPLLIYVSWKTSSKSASASPFPSLFNNDPMMMQPQEPSLVQKLLHTMYCFMPITIPRM